MSESNVTEGAEDKAPAPLKNKTPNMRELEARMKDSQEQAHERMDALELEIGDLGQNVSKVLAMLEGMSAQNRPLGAKPGTDAEEVLDQVATPNVSREIDLNGNMQEIAVTDMSLEEIGQQQLDRLKFDQEVLTIQLAPAMDETHDPRVEVSVNGRSVILLRNQPYKVQRMYVEVLARAQPMTYANQEYTKADGVRAIRYEQNVGMRYPFQVLHDPNPLGDEWLRGLLSRRH